MYTEAVRYQINLLTKLVTVSEAEDVLSITETEQLRIRIKDVDSGKEIAALGPN